MGLKQRNDEKFPIGGGVEHADLLGKVLGVLCLGVWVDIQADGIEATLVNDKIKAAICVAHVQKVHFCVSHARDISFIHFLDDFRDEIYAGDIGLVQNGAQFLRKQGITATGDQNSLSSLCLYQPLLKVGHEVLKVSVPLEGLHIRAFIVCVDLFGLEKVGPELLRLELFRILVLKVERGQLDRQSIVFLLLLLRCRVRCFDHGLLPS